MSESGEVLLVGNGVHTLDGADGDALLISGDRIQWVGASDDAPPARRQVTLDGWITPAFVDAHVHATATGLALDGLDLAEAGSAAECLELLREHAARTGAPVLLGGPWDDHTWPEGVPPTAAQVSAAAPGRTVLLTRVDAHSCVVDEGTLSRLPLTELDGVQRDTVGAPTGFLREDASEAAMTLVRTLLPAAQVAEARQGACRRAASLGIASLHEMGHPGLSGLEDSRTWAAGRWPVEVLVWWAEIDASVALREGLRPGGDLFLDGSIGSRSAALSAPYADGGGEDQGMLFHGDEEVRDFFSDCTAAGVGGGVHAIGDAAIAQACEALEAVEAAHGLDAVRRCRHRIEHLELATREQLGRLGRLGVVASVQPAFDRLWGGSDRLYATRFGPERACRSNPLAWMAEEGLVLAFGSDSTVTPLDPWGGVVAAQEHRGGLGVARAAALAAHVMGGRFAAGQDDVGSLRAGSRADLAVWDDDPLRVEDPRTLQCLATFVAGSPAHDADGVLA